MRLLVVFHSRSGSTRRMCDAVVSGARDPAIDGVEVVVQGAFDTGADDVQAAGAVILGTPENFGYMSGALKDFFDRVYYPLLDDPRHTTAGMPYGLFVKGAHDGSGAVRAVERIVTGLEWRQVQPPVVAVPDITEEVLDRCYELGGSIAAGLSLGMY